MTVARWSYGHQAVVFREALIDTRRVEDALRILDGYRIRALALETSDVLETIERIATVFDSEIGCLFPHRGEGRDLSDPQRVLPYILRIRGWTSLRIAILSGTDDASILSALDDITHRPALMTAAQFSRTIWATPTGLTPVRDQPER